MKHQILGQIAAIIFAQIFIKPILEYLGVLKWAREFKTDWVTGVGLAFLIVLTPMAMIVLWVKGCQ